MPTPYSKKAQEIAEKQAQGLEQSGQEYSQGITALAEQYARDLDAANKARQDAYNSAMAAYQQRMNEGYTQFGDIIRAEKERADAAARDALAQRKAEQSAARWTGAAELASSIANLIGVGGYNAVSQQYKPYSQDWMRRADENWKANRARFDNLRDRQRALQQQLIQLRMGDAGTALNMATKQADMGYQHGTTAAQAKYQTQSAPLTIKYQTDEKANAARAQGANTGLSLDFHADEGAKNRSTQRSIASMRSNSPSIPKGTYKLRVGDGTYLVSTEAIVSNILAHRDKIHLSEDQREEFENLMEKSQKEQAQFLMQAIDDNPEIQQIIIDTSYGKVEDSEEVDSAAARIAAIG